jgi:hypothetical protein
MGQAWQAAVTQVPESPLAESPRVTVPRGHHAVTHQGATQHPHCHPALPDPRPGVQVDRGW